VDEASLTRTRELYDTVAATYAHVLPDASSEAVIDLALIREFVDRLGERPTVLDIGCGTGRMIAHLRSLDDTLRPIGIDLSPAMLAHARSAHPDTTFLEGRLDSVPFGAGEADGILAWYSLIHTAPSDVPDVFAEFGRLLRDGGMLLIGFQAGAGERTVKNAYGHRVQLHAFLHDVARAAAQLTRAGFTIEMRVERAARPHERHAQGFVLARRVPFARDSVAQR
jgi:ubiquinone/menaquinone biosynthesis C-methylase UbiE